MTLDYQLRYSPTLWVHRVFPLVEQSNSPFVLLITNSLPNVLFP